MAKDRSATLKPLRIAHTPIHEILGLPNLSHSWANPTSSRLPKIQAMTDGASSIHARDPCHKPGQNSKANNSYPRLSKLAQHADVYTVTSCFGCTISVTFICLPSTSQLVVIFGYLKGANKVCFKHQPKDIGIGSTTSHHGMCIGLVPTNRLFARSRMRTDYKQHYSTVDRQTNNPRCMIYMYPCAP